MKKSKNIALVAHDNRKKDLIEWAEWNFKVLSQHHLVCTGTTGKLLEEVITTKYPKWKIPLVGYRSPN
jgi:methylglyoxal synthase